MKKVPLTQGEFALVDDEDYVLVSQYKWHLHKGRKTNYARIKNKHICTTMHRMVLVNPEGLVDHINGNGLDNRKENLRVCTNAQNIRNMVKTSGSSKYKGVTWDKRCNKWAAAIWLNYKRIHLGRYSSEIDAAKAYNEAAIRLFGDFANLNTV
jgi:hypothetical protein